jgi:hypothetical protein
MAESLSEPRPRIPQDEMVDQIASAERLFNIDAEILHTDPKLLDEDAEGGSNEWTSTPGITNLQFQGSVPSADAFVKLREMLAKLRKPRYAIADTTIATSPFRLAEATETVSTLAGLTPIQATAKAANAAPQENGLLQ